MNMAPKRIYGPIFKPWLPPLSDPDSSNAPVKPPQKNASLSYWLGTLLSFFLRLKESSKFWNELKPWDAGKSKVLE